MTSAAYAHEKRAVGEYEFVVGYVNEPAFAGAMNALDVRISKKEEPVPGVETLKASVQYEDGAERLEVTLKPRHRDPGKYAGYFFPTKPGTYTFYVTGKIGETQINEVFSPKPMGDAETLKWPK